MDTGTEMQAVDIEVEEITTCRDTHQSSTCTNKQENSDRSGSKYLQELYQRECLYTINDKKINYIQNKIETVVVSLLTKILKSEYYQSEVDLKVSKRLKKFEHPVQISRMVTDKNFLKVGSFYEGTKNSYPDEFDFICVLAECDLIDYLLMEKVISILIDIFHSWIRRHSQKDIADCLPVSGNLEFNGYFEVHGPAAKLEVIFTDINTESERQSVFVDISPAARVHLVGTLPEDMEVCFTDWKDIILETGSILMVKLYSLVNPKHDTETKVTITESELFVIKNKMSEKHRQVYRLLKYILNGHSSEFDGKIKRLVRKKSNLRNTKYVRLNTPVMIYNLSSYAIKLMVFHHMQRCQNSATGMLADCVVDVLNKLVSLIQTAGALYKPVSFWQYCWSDDAFSVSVQTMSGQTVEIFDEYSSAKEIGDMISEIAVCIKSNESGGGSHEMTAQIPLISQAPDIVETIMSKKQKRNKRFRCLVVIPIVILTIYLSVLIALMIKSSTKVLYCWNGTEYIENLKQRESNMSYEVLPENLTTVLNSELTTELDTNVSVLTGQLFCINFDAVNSSSKVVETPGNSGLYACRADNRCSGENMFDDYRVVNRSQTLPLLCKSYAFKTKSTSPRLLNSANTQDQQNTSVCLHKESCLNVSRLTYEDGNLRETAIYKCRTEIDCEKPILRDISLASCVLYQTARSKSMFGKAETEVCCCETGSCYKPLPNHDKDWVNYGIYTGFVIAIFLLVFMCVIVVVFCRLTKNCCWYIPTGRGIIYDKTRK